jgi:iron complex outermembrane receptor protein
MRLHVPTCLLLASLSAAAQTPADETPVIVITGSPSARAAAEAPYAIGVVDAATLRSAGPMVNLSEAMARVPGLVVANRNNYAQDLQISSRGFGSRAGFGVRGLRLYTDGIPASMPDGQGQVSHFDLAGAQRIEVLRGPFSVLYGNSSGGVISLISAPVREAGGEVALDAGSFGLRQLRGSVATRLGDSGFDLRAGVSAFEFDGFRPHSAAKRTFGNVRLGYGGERDRVVLIANALDQPADDPLGLSRAQFDDDPYQTTPQATQFDTRKTARQAQIGAAWTHAFDAGALRESRLAVYAGERSVAQWLAIAPGTQGPPRHGGGVIDFDRRYSGLEGRLVWRWDAIEAVTGIAVEAQRDDRRGYENFTGTGAGQVLGVTGNLRRDEANAATSRDLFAQAEWTIAPTLVASGGLRSGQVRLSADDRYLSNGDDSGRLKFSYTNPVLGLRWTAAPGLNLHASVARGFESPTLGELAYRPDGLGGFNDTLRPQKSKQAELGAKWRSGAFDIDATLFHVEVDDEIGVATNAGGRSSFQNVGRTKRSGAELGGSWRMSPQWRSHLALTLLDATYRDGFLACAGIPCTAPSVPVAAGNRIAGTQRGSGYAELAWTPGAQREVALELRGGTAVVVNDTNTDAAGRYVIGNLRWLERVTFGNGMKAELLLRVDNVADKVYAGSVIVNDANGRFLEAGSPRSWFVGLRLLGGL